MIDVNFDVTKCDCENPLPDQKSDTGGTPEFTVNVLEETDADRYMKLMLEKHRMSQPYNSAQKCIRCGMDLSDGQSETVICEVSMSTGGQLRYRLCRPCATDAVNEFQEMARQSVKSV